MKRDKNRLVVGQSILMFVPPGWLVAGKITERSQQSIFLEDAVYLENVNSGQSPMLLGGERIDTKKIFSSTFPMKKLWVQTSAILFHQEISEDYVRALMGKKELNAIEKV